jgi:hypothetical protein
MEAWRYSPNYIPEHSQLQGEYGELGASHSRVRHFFCLTGVSMPRSKQCLTTWADLHVRLSQETLGQLKAHAESKERSLTQMIRDILNKYLKDHPITTALFIATFLL